MALRLHDCPWEGEGRHRFLIHDRDAIYVPAVDRAIRSMGLRVLKTPVRTPQANAFCERLIGTRRRGSPRPHLVERQFFRRNRFSTARCACDVSPSRTIVSRPVSKR